MPTKQGYQYNIMANIRLFVFRKGILYSVSTDH
jgi:hypothetical protein